MLVGPILLVAVFVKVVLLAYFCAMSDALGHKFALDTRLHELDAQIHRGTS